MPRGFEAGKTTVLIPTFQRAVMLRRGSLLERFPVDHKKHRWLKYDQWSYFELVAPLSDDRFEEPGARGAAHRRRVNESRACSGQ